jgi:2-phospho-L-lactate guanylyltransferase
MSLWAVIPAKDPAIAKSRLAPRLSPSLRRALSLRLLERTIQVVDATPEVSRWVVISNALEPLALARRLGGLAIHELRSGAGGGGPDTIQPRTIEEMEATARRAEHRLNAALQQAAAVAERNGATALLVLHADLLLLNSAALSAFISAGAGTLSSDEAGGINAGAVDPGQHGTADVPGLVQAAHQPSVTIAPDRHGLGTNALLLRPPGAIQFAFGPHSYTRHLALASETGAATIVHNDTRFAIDLDTPEDLDLLYTLTPDLDPLPGSVRQVIHHGLQPGEIAADHTFLAASGRCALGSQT